jgi:hypothetical protein
VFEVIDDEYLDLVFLTFELQTQLFLDRGPGSGCVRTIASPEAR